MKLWTKGNNRPLAISIPLDLTIANHSIHRIILDNDPQQIASRVTKKSEGDNIPLSEQSLAQAFRTAQEQFAKSLLK